MRTIQKEVLKRFREIAEKHNVPLQVVKDIEASIWVMTREEIDKAVKNDYNTFKNIYIRFLGTFYAHKGKFKHTNKRKNEE